MKSILSPKNSVRFSKLRSTILPNHFSIPYRVPSSPLPVPPLPRHLPLSFPRRRESPPHVISRTQPRHSRPSLRHSREGGNLPPVHIIPAPTPIIPVPVYVIPAKAEISPSRHIPHPTPSFPSQSTSFPRRRESPPSRHFPWPPQSPFAPATSSRRNTHRAPAPSAAVYPKITKNARR